MEPVNLIPVRRIGFRYPPGTLKRHYAQGDLVLSHMLAVMSAVFPAGEEFFIRSVQQFSDQITDPNLKAAVRGFTGQEVTHGREHRLLNEHLYLMGYPVRTIERLTQRTLDLTSRYAPDRYSLALTAALEHFTATAAEQLLGNPKTREMLGENEVRSILLWHALEETEHKAVAFDVYQTVGGTERMRIWTMRWTIFSTLVGLLVATALSMLTDRAAYNPLRLLRSIATAWRFPFFTLATLEQLMAYTRTGFHPTDIDNTELLIVWRDKLFGQDGQLADRLK
ncbi:metal-dependent hydrolase [Mycobacteroides saopaulense]|uniref:Metal-dependent hydrolase n=1 Tax=Mycobacteroides saopaulense TaxID=1578165 RepID=A0ABX3C1K3_9MYCO|nr:metal-dependent hydrolase [Mycobacteroides saopaulense]OHT82736.1 metal-dependent hydrolase [Mycobacteroides saopaulense]OHU10279.1 metal-dependent hydrolase [Mycobacteroides saopaulense]